MDRTLLKRDARERMRRYQPNPIVIGLIVFALCYILERLIVNVMGLNFQFNISNWNVNNPDEMMALFDDIQKQYMRQLADYSPSFFGCVLAVALGLMELMVNTGKTIYALHVTREEKADYGNLLDGFAVFSRVVILSVLEGVFILLWSLLLIVPGIIASYRYRQAIYLLLDHPDYTPMQCLRLSSEMMRGHKMELFTLDLSFLGWEILRALLPPFAIWLWPYEALTFANYYRTLVHEPVPAIPGGNVFEGEFTEVNDDDDREGWH